MLFVAALAICLIKGLAASVALENYRYQPVDAQIINFKARSQHKAMLKPSKTAISLAKAKSTQLQAAGRHSLNKAYMDKEAANS